MSVTPRLPRRLRIALISEHASPLAAIGGVDAGGQNIYVAQVARALARLGHRVDVLTRRDDPLLPAVVEAGSGVRVFHVDAGPPCFVPKERLLAHMPAFATAARRLLREQPPYDVLHANFFMSGWVGLDLKAAFGTPLAITFHALGRVRREHQGDADGFPPERIAIEQRLVHACDAIVAECPQDQADLERLYGADRARMAMVPCGVDLDAFAPGDRTAARHALGLGSDDFIVLQLGRLVPRKGIDNVIRALAWLPAGMPARLLVVGGDREQPDEHATPEIARLRGVAREAGVADRVTFLGCRQRDALAGCYAASDVFVTTPWYEPFGITPLEAMACARPVVGSAVGGIAYTVVDGVTGFLVPPRDPAALATRLARLHADPAVGRAFGAAGLARVRSMFTWERVAEQLVEVYRGLGRACRSGRRAVAVEADFALDTAFEAGDGVAAAAGASGAAAGIAADGAVSAVRPQAVADGGRLGVATASASATAPAVPAMPGAVAAGPRAADSAAVAPALHAARVVPRGARA